MPGGFLPPQFDSLSPEEQDEYFRRLEALKAAGPPPLPVTGKTGAPLHMPVRNYPPAAQFDPEIPGEVLDPDVAPTGGIPLVRDVVNPPPAAGLSPGQLQLEYDPLEELRRFREKEAPDLRKLADTMVDEKGNMFGYEPQGASREELMQRASAAYDKLPARGPARNWEEEFLKRNAADQERLERAYLLQTFVNGPEAAGRHQEMLQRRIADREAGLREAYERSWKGDPNAPVSRAAVEAMAASRIASPEALAGVTANDPTVSGYKSGAYSIGPRLEGQQTGLTKSRENIMARFGLQDQEDAAALERMLLGQANNRDIARINASGKMGALMQDPALRQRILGSWFASSLGISPDQGARVAAGDLSGLTPDQQRKAQIMAPQFEQAASSPKVLDQVVAGTTKEETQREGKVQTAVEKSLEVAKSNPKYRQDWEQSWTDAKQKLQEAVEGWNSLTDRGKFAFTKFSPKGWSGIVANFVQDSGDQAKASRLQALINQIIKEQSGSAVTDSEMGRVAVEAGFPKVSWDMFNSEEAVKDFMRRIAVTLKNHRDIYQRNFGGWGFRAGGADAGR